MGMAMWGVAEGHSLAAVVFVLLAAISLCDVYFLVVEEASPLDLHEGTQDVG